MPVPFSREWALAKLEEIRTFAKANRFFVNEDPHREYSFYAKSANGEPNRFTLERDEKGRYDIWIHRADQPNASVPIAESDLSWVTNNWFPSVG